MRELGGLGPQELAPRGDVEEQVAHLDRRSGLAGDGPSFAPRATLADELPAAIGAFDARAHREPRHGGNARQRFATKTERRHAIEIVERRELAGGMSRHRQLEVVGVDADTVVVDGDALHTALLHLDDNAPGAGVDAVLEQLLDHRSGALDDLAGSDLIDKARFELSNARSG